MLRNREDRGDRRDRQEKIMRTALAGGDIKATLPELPDRMIPGDEVILTRNRQPVAKLVSEAAAPASKPRPGPGLGKGMITFIAPDFDAPLDCLKEYME